MQSKELSGIRNYLDKTQSELAQLLCVSTKAVQSWEQGWRNIPAGIERQLLLLLSLRKKMDKSDKPCWKIKNCPYEWRKKCSAWEFRAGNLCWFINGTFCEGSLEKDWAKKIKKCRNCDVFKLSMPDI